MKHSSRLLIFDTLGVPETPAYSRLFTSDGAYRDAKAARRGMGTKVVNTRRLREGRDTAGKLGQDEGDSGSHCNALIPTFTLEFPEAFNTPEAWHPCVSGDEEFLDEAPHAFRRRGIDSPALSYTGPVQDVGFYSRPGLGGLLVEQNMGWGARIQLNRPPRSVARPVFQLRWATWTFEIADGQAAIMRRNDLWTQVKEDELNGWLELDEIDEETQILIDARREEIYDQYDRLSFNRSGDDFYGFGNAFTIAFLPEERGQLNIFLGGGDMQSDELVTIPIKRLLAERKPGMLWSRSRVSVSNNAGHFWFQVGQFKFARENYVLLEKWKTPQLFSSLPTMEFTVQASAPTGTTCTVENEILSDYWAQIAIRQSTSDTRFCSFFYGAAGLMNSGEWDGGRATVWDSNDVLIADGSPIEDIRVSFTGSMRKVQYEVILRDIRGAQLQSFMEAVLGQNYPSLEDRVCSLYIDGSLRIAHGLVTISTPSDMAQGVPNQVRAWVTRNTSRVVMTITDGWGPLEECLMSDTLVLDGLTLGAAVVKVLRYAGVPENKVNGIATTGPNAGPLIKGAALGEKWAEQNSEDQTVANYLRYLMDHYGMGRELWLGKIGNWLMGFRSTTVKAEFTSQDDSSRHRVLRPLDMPRDTSEFANVFRAVGKGPLGKAISYVWTTWRSFRLQGGQYPPDYIGRIKRHPTVQSDAWRTVGTLAWVTRSLFKRFGKPPRFYSFESYWDDSLAPGDRVTFDTVPCEIMQITGGSLQKDRMSFLLQEVYP